MSLYTGNEFDQLKGVQGNAVKLIWLAIKDKFINYSLEIGSAIGIESAARTLAINNLQAQITGMKLITPWNPNDPFPAKKSDGSSFEAASYVRITATVGDYKAGDMLICIADVPGDATIADFADVETNIELATELFSGTVKIIAEKAAYLGSADNTAVITKVLLQQVLADLQNEITSSFEDADAALSQTITTAYNLAITNTIANYYSKTEVDAIVDGTNTKLSSLATYLQTEMWGAIANTLQKIPVVSDVISVVVAHPSLANSLVGSCVVGQRPFLYFTQEGFKLKGKEIVSTLTTWAGIEDANKADFDYYLVKNPDTFVYTVLFNTENYTQEVVQTFTVCQLVYGGAISIETAMSQSVVANPFDKTKVGGANTATATADLNALVFPIEL